MSETTSIVSSIDQRLEELADEIQQLEQARSALTAAAAVNDAARNGAAATNGATANEAAATNGATANEAAATTGVAATGPARPARRSRRVRSQPSRRAALRREDLEQLLSATPDGMSANTIAEQAGAGYQETLRLLRELEGADRVRREGSRRSTRWRLITDEDRIAERTAELERLSRART